MNNIVLYYKNDKFCNKYCIDKNYKYGCVKQQCPYKHSINLYRLVFDTKKWFEFVLKSQELEMKVNDRYDDEYEIEDYTVVVIVVVMMMMMNKMKKNKISIIL